MTEIATNTGRLPSPSQIAPRRPGRPRCPKADAAIVKATLELVMEQGFTGLSIEAVAERARVSKTTIYRRCDSKAELVMRAIKSMGIHVPEPPDTGSFRGDMLAIAEEQARDAKNAGVPVLTFPRVLAEAALSDPELHGVLRRGIVEPRTRALERLIRRAIERGELRADLDVEITVDLVFGALVFVGLRNGRGWTEERHTPERVVDALLAGIATERPE